MKTTIYLLLFLSFFLLTSCNTDQDFQSNIAQGHLTLRMTTSKANTSETVDHRQINNLKGYLFENGILTEVYSELSVNEEGVVEGIDLTTTPNARLYLLANVAGMLDEKQFTKNSFLESDLKRLAVTSDPMTEKGVPFVMAGQLDTNDVTEGKATELWLTRGFARLDVEPVSGVVIERIAIDEVAQSGYLLEQESVQVPKDTKRGMLEKAGKPFLETRTEGVFYLYEQTGNKLSVTITARINGIQNILEAKLPNVIKRNFAYNLKVTTAGANVEAEIQELPWDFGENPDADLDLIQNIKVDVTNSTLSSGVRVNEDRDTVFVPCHGREFRIALDTKTDGEVEIRADGEGHGVTVTPLPAQNAFDVATVLPPPGTAERYLYIDVRNVETSDSFNSRIVIVIERNTTLFTGKIQPYFTEEATCEISEYMDGELGFVEVNAGSEVTTEGEWLKVERTADDQQRYRILAGYRPNDPDADGRMQNGNFKVTHPDGTVETYPVSRPNNGLPVVLIDGIYWCKFNLRGNARSFEDQIQINDPIAQEEDLYAYLKTCTDEQYMELMGDAYKGTNHTGLKLIHTGTGSSSYAYRDYASTSAGTLINTAPDPTKQCPPGYQVPDFSEHYVKLLGNRTTHFTGDEDELHTSYMLLGKTHTIYRYIRRDVRYDDEHSIPEMYLNNVEIENNPSLALYGTGCQSNNINLDFSFLLFATTGNSVSALGGAFMTMTNQNVSRTRIIRCVKIPTDFIY